MRVNRHLAGLRAAALAVVALAGFGVQAQTTFNFTGAAQSYTLPSGAGGIQIQADAGGGGGGATDAPGNGGSGGAGARANGIYYVAPLTVVNVFVGGGGALGYTSTNGRDCTNSAGAGGSAGGAGGFAGGMAGQAGCNGYSGGGGGGGAASTVSTSANSPLVVAGGGGGGQGGALNVLGKNGPGSTATGAVGAVGSAGGVGGTTTDGGGGGGGGGGCPGGAGGAANPDSAGTNNTLASTAGSSCRASTVNSFTVTTSTIGTGGAGGVGNAVPGVSGLAGRVVITPLFPTLNLLKSQPSPALAVGTTSAYTLTVSTPAGSTTPAFVARVVDLLPANLTYNGYSGTGWTCVGSAGLGGTTSVSCVYSGSIPAGGGTAVLVLNVTPTSNQSVTNYAVVDNRTEINPPTVPTTCTAANTPTQGCATPVVSQVSTQLSGRVYGDANYNNSLDGSETGTGVAGLFVKLAPLSGGVCQTPVTVSAPVTVGTGTWSMSGVAQGNYCLILDNNSTTSDITPFLPANWIGTQNASGVIQVTIGSAPTPPQNFGLFNGSKLTGTVFADTGAPTGTANNGVKEAAETGLSGVTVNTSAAAVTGTVSAGDGSYTLWIPASATGALTVTAQPGSTYLATGGTVGTTGGSYTRPSLVFTPAAGQSYTAANFGLVTRNTLAPNNAETAPPGTTVNYAHMFVADSGGSVTFSLSGTATPASTAWNEILYRDSNCNAVLESTEPVVSGPITVTAGQTLCLIVKEFVPAGAATGAINTVTLTAVFTYTNANPALSATLTAVDVTTVGQPGALALGKLVNNVTQGGAAATAVNAKPGDTLQYTLTATNNGSQALSTLQINDATPAFTTFLSASCPAVLPAGITACAVSTQPAVGAQGGIQWTLTGALASAAQLVVTYRVKVDQ